MISLKTQNWTIENINTVLLDKDGTFIDLHYFWGKMTEMRAEEIIKHYQAPSEQFSNICKFLGYDITNKKMHKDGITALYSRPKIINLLNKSLHTDLNINSTEQELEYIFDKVSLEFYKDIKDYTKPINEAIEFIKQLHSKNIELGIVTSDSIESTQITLKQFGWENLFKVVIGRESSTEPKESGVPTKLALNKLKATPETTVMIGDAPMDSISAQNANIKKTILVSTGQIDIDELKNHSQYTVNNLKEIEIIL